MKLDCSYARKGTQNVFNLIYVSVFELENSGLQPVDFRVLGQLGCIDVIDVALFVIAESSRQCDGVEGFFQGYLLEVNGDFPRDLFGRCNVDLLLHSEGGKSVPYVSVNQT